MNLLEHYILEIYDIQKPKADKDWMHVDMTIVCYGKSERTIVTFIDEADFERAINNGYYMA